MKNTGAILTALVLLVLVILAIGYASTQAAENERARGQAESQIIRAQAESRLTSATAGAITSAALLPWFALTILGVLGLAIVALAGAIVVRPPRPPVERIIERQILYLPPPGQRRGETWAALTGGEYIRLEPSNCVVKEQTK